MKKISLLFLFVGLLGVVKAQDNFSLGVKAGFNSTSINLSDVPAGEKIKNEAKNGFLFGAFGRIKLIGDLSFQPEIYYAQKQTQYVFASDNAASSNNVTSTINTWDIPLLANIQLVNLEVIKFYGVAGPVASYISKDDINSLDGTNWTFQAGLGAHIWRLSADVRYEWGMKDVSKMQFGQRTDVLTFSLAYSLFNL